MYAVNFQLFPEPLIIHTITTIFLTHNNTFSVYVIYLESF